MKIARKKEKKEEKNATTSASNSHTKQFEKTVGVKSGGFLSLKV
jgi:hypothetical protein